MSIEKIENMDTGVSVHIKQVPQKQPTTPVNDNASVVHEPSAKDSATKVSYPPFLPVGDTQSIYKK